uniref:Transcriptional regulator n=1 Tax=Heterorhabditis bacteriophora TaxID=37862 RepID=A0A1I7XF18_HETBA
MIKIYPHALFTPIAIDGMVHATRRQIPPNSRNHLRLLAEKMIRDKFYHH